MSNRFERVASFIVGRGLALKIREKSDSALMKLIGLIMFFNPAFMEQYTTTIGSTVYFPDGYTVRQPDDAARTLAHEGVHIGQAKRIGAIRFSLAYLFPLPLAVLALGAFAAFWWLPALWCLLFLVFLAPLPSPWRVKYEREAYLITAICDAARGWEITADWYVEYMVNHYCGWAYYKPSWRKSYITKMVQQDMALAVKILNGEASEDYATALIKVLKA